MARHGMTLLIGLLAAIASARTMAAEPATPDILDLASGAVVLSFTSQYDQGGWSALSLIDGTAKTGWSSASGKATPSEFVIELARSYALESFAIDNSTAQEGGYPGISARGFVLHVSTAGPDGPWIRALAAEAPKGKRRTFGLPAGTQGRWLKLVVASNWGHTEYNEIMELEATGQPVGSPPDLIPISGVYATNYNLFLVRQDGNQVTGCYDWDQGVLSGQTDGRVIRFEWRETGPQIGTAVMVLSASGDFLNGLWYEGGALKGTWFGPRAKPGQKPNCVAPRENAFAQSIAATGEAIVYGINFDHDSAKIRADSASTLGQIAKLLASKPELKLQIEGHTDATGADAYNRELSERRAQAVVAWLAGNGVAGNRLRAQGKGEGEPVADNASPQGRALNRRVVLKAL